MCWNSRKTRSSPFCKYDGRRSRARRVCARLPAVRARTAIRNAREDTCHGGCFLFWYGTVRQISVSRLQPTLKENGAPEVLHPTALGIREQNGYKSGVGREEDQRVSRGGEVDAPQKGLSVQSQSADMPVGDAAPAVDEDRIPLENAVARHRAVGRGHAEVGPLGQDRDGVVAVLVRRGEVISDPPAEQGGGGTSEDRREGLDLVVGRGLNRARFVAVDGLSGRPDEGCERVQGQVARLSFLTQVFSEGHKLLPLMLLFSAQYRICTVFPIYFFIFRSECHLT